MGMVIFYRILTRNVDVWDFQSVVFAWKLLQKLTFNGNSLCEFWNGFLFYRYLFYKHLFYKGHYFIRINSIGIYSVGGPFYKGTILLDIFL